MVNAQQINLHILAFLQDFIRENGRKKRPGIEGYYNVKVAMKRY